MNPIFINELNKKQILYGLIGYTYLQSTTTDINNPQFILVISDNHSKLAYCSNYKMISDWLKNK